MKCDAAMNNVKFRDVRKVKWAKEKMEKRDSTTFSDIIPSQKLTIIKNKQPTSRTTSRLKSAPVKRNQGVFISTSCCHKTLEINPDVFHAVRPEDLLRKGSFLDGVSLNYTLWCTGVTRCKSRHTVLLIFAPQMYANLQPWLTREELLA